MKAYNDRAFEYHMLTPLVMECAVEGDPVCLEIIKRSSKHLLELPVALLPDYKKEKVDVALMGGIIENNTLLAGLLQEGNQRTSKIEFDYSKGHSLGRCIPYGA